VNASHPGGQTGLRSVHSKEEMEDENISMC